MDRALRPFAIACLLLGGCVVSTSVPEGVLYSCGSDADCPDGTSCHIQVYCARNCKSDADCLDGTACDGTRCLPVCENADQCGNNGCSMPGSLCD